MTELVRPTHLLDEPQPDWGHCSWDCECGQRNRWEISICRCGYVRCGDEPRWWEPYGRP